MIVIFLYTAYLKIQFISHEIKKGRGELVYVFILHTQHVLQNSSRGALAAFLWTGFKIQHTNGRRDGERLKLHEHPLIEWTVAIERRVSNEPFLPRYFSLTS